MSRFELMVERAMNQREIGPMSDIHGTREELVEFIRGLNAERDRLRAALEPVGIVLRDLKLTGGNPAPTAFED